MLRRGELDRPLAEDLALLSDVVQLGVDLRADRRDVVFELCNDGVELKQLASLRLALDLDRRAHAFHLGDPVLHELRRTLRLALLARERRRAVRDLVLLRSQIALLHLAVLRRRINLPPELLQADARVVLLALKRVFVSPELPNEGLAVRLLVRRDGLALFELSRHGVVLELEVRDALRRRRDLEISLELLLLLR